MERLLLALLENIVQVTDQYEMGKDKAVIQETSRENSNDILTKDEVMEGIKNIKVCKAPANDKVKAEMIRKMGGAGMCNK